MPRKNAKRREKAIRKAMGSFGKKKNPALEKASGRRGSVRRAGETRSFDLPERRSGKSSSPGGKRLYASDDGIFTVSGTFSYSGRGFGFLVPDPEFARAGIGDVFIPPRQTAGAMTGDRVTARISKTGFREDGSEGCEGEILNVEPACSSLVGTLLLARGTAVVAPDSKRWGTAVLLSYSEAVKSGARDGWKVRIVPSGGEPFFIRGRSIRMREDFPSCELEGKIAEVYGDGISKDANYAAILASSGIRTEFPESALAAAEEAAAEPVDPALAPDRRDLCEKIVFTIDGAGAKDLDDAISLEKRGENWVLGVHIADVSHYVRPDSPTEREAALRGTSVYFTDKVVPMLPAVLSNGACSLNAGADRYAITAEITLSPDGERLGTEIFRSVIRSRVRGVYEEVNDLFENGPSSPFAEKYAEIAPMLSDMRGLYGILLRKSRERGMLELEDGEAAILLDEDGEPAEIVKVVRGEGERLIEQFMLQANMGVAETLLGLGLPCLYRVHAKPEDEKLRTFAAFASGLGLDTRGIAPTETDGREDRKSRREDANADPRDLLLRLRRLLADAEERGQGPMISAMLLRSLSKARYEAQPAPHFGLGAGIYCHFTSPIRRYPDLFVHSVITAVLEESGFPCLTSSKNLPERAAKAAAKFEKVAEERGYASTECEIRAMEAEREIEDLYITLYMAKHIGEEFEAVLSGVTRSGVFVRCENLAEGFVPLTEWPSACADEERMTLTLRGRTMTLGSPLKVILREADPSSRRITFGVVRDEEK